MVKPSNNLESNSPTASIEENEISANVSIKIRAVEGIDWIYNDDITYNEADYTYNGLTYINTDKPISRIK